LLNKPLAGFNQRLAVSRYQLQQPYLRSAPPNGEFWGCPPACAPWSPLARDGPCTRVSVKIETVNDENHSSYVRLLRDQDVCGEGSKQTQDTLLLLLEMPFAESVVRRAAVTLYRQRVRCPTRGPLCLESGLRAMNSLMSRISMVGRSHPLFSF
jgi:hypothetical protein